MVKPEDEPKKQDVHITLDSIGAGAGASIPPNMDELTFQQKMALKYPKGFRRRKR